MRLRTSIEPQQEGLLVRLLLGLEEPVEERLVAACSDIDVAGVVREADHWLPREPCHEVGLWPRAPGRSGGSPSRSYTE